MIDKWRCNDISYMLTSSNSANFITSSTSYFNINDDIDYDGDSISIASNTSDVATYSTNSSTVEYEACNSTTFLTSELSSCDCTFLHMKYIYGYDYNEIGSEFNVSSSTVSNRVNYLKSKLKKHKQEILE